MCLYNLYKKERSVESIAGDMHHPVLLSEEEESKKGYVIEKRMGSENDRFLGLLTNAEEDLREAIQDISYEDVATDQNVNFFAKGILAEAILGIEKVKECVLNKRNFDLYKAVPKDKISK